MNEMPVTPPDEKVHSFHFHLAARPHKSIFFIIVALIVGVIIGHYFSKPTQTISVVGAAQLDVQADMATISGSFESTAKKKDQALSENQKKIAKLKTILASQGLSDKNIKNINSTTIDDTEEYEVPVPLSTDTTMPTPTPACLGNCAGGGGGSGGGGFVERIPNTNSYISTTDFEIVLAKNDLGKREKLQEILETDLEIQNIDALYSIGDKTAYDAQLRQKALNYGRAQADLLAKSTGLKVKRLVSIHEQKDPYGEGTVDQFESSTPEIPLFASYETSYELGPGWLPF